MSEECVNVDTPKNFEGKGNSLKYRINGKNLILENMKLPPSPLSHGSAQFASWISKVQPRVWAAKNENMLQHDILRCRISL